MKVLIACEFSGIVRDAFSAKGHDSWSCDLLPTEKPGNHIQGNVLEILNDGWDLMIAHPPCTRLCNSGVCWLEKRDLWDELAEASDFFCKFLNANIEKIAIENPRMHKYAIEGVGGKHNQVLQPWMFGHGETKATCLWLKNLPPLFSTNIVTGRDQRVFREPPSKDRAKIRSVTYRGIANAMAEQWG